MLRTMQKMRAGSSRSRQLRVEPLENRLCLSTYTTVDLVPLDGHDYSVALGVNDNSVAVGRSHSPDSSERAAVVWTIDSLGDASVCPLPSVDGDPYAGVHATQVNNNGMISGQTYVLDDPQDPESEAFPHATVWTGSPGTYTAHDLNTLGEDFVWSDAHSISEPDAYGNSWVVGISGLVGGTSTCHAVLWQVAPAGDVISTTDLEPYESDVWANDVTVVGDSVFVVGDFPRDPGVVQACVWEVNLAGEVMGRTDLGTDDFDAVTASALNHDGDVVGDGFNSVLERHAYLSEFPHDGSPESITDLGSLGNQSSRAEGINDNGVVVGRYYNVTPPSSIRVGQSYAFVREGGVTDTLLDRVSDRTFYHLFCAYDVNNNGEIVGNGRAGKRNDSEEHGFMARPESTEPSPPSVSIDDVTVNEADGSADFTVSLSKPADADVTVTYETADGTATAGSDYESTSGVLTIPAGQTSGMISVPVIDDAVPDEGNEMFTVNLVNATDAAIDDGQGQGTIVDDDSQAGSYVFSSTDTPLAIANAHPRKGARTTVSELNVTTNDLVQTLTIGITLDGASDMSDLNDMVLTSPSGTLVSDLTPVFGVSTVDLTASFLDEDPFGVWTLAITDTDKANTHTLTGWSLTINDPAEAAAVDLALLAWMDSDSADADESDLLADQAAQNLAMMMKE